MRLLYLLVAIMYCSPLVASGQTPFEPMALDNLSAFESTTSNWQIVGSALSDYEVVHSLDTQPGVGVLANLQTEEAKGHLFSAWNHSDIELDLEVLMPKGSNSGVYLQSRYEVQLLDSWGVTEPKQSDIGGIYQRWDESRPEGQRGYEGHPPRFNVARAPGLWQHLNILFRAPRFDESGNKIENARFERVMLNGVVVHENVEVTGPTRAAAHEDEVPQAPFMIQGDHGPVAFRNMKYRMFRPTSIALSDLSLKYYEGEFNHQMPDLSTLSVVQENEVANITSKDAQSEREFVMEYSGTLNTPVTGTYIFEVAHTSRVRLEINGNEVLTDQSERVNGLREFPRNAASIDLGAGAHSFKLVYAKGRWHGAPTTLGFFGSGPGLMRAELTESGSMAYDAYSAFEVAPNQEPWLQRNFVPHQGEKRTHAISVGYPAGINYSYDMSRGALLHVWKGPFVDASTMWYQRGNMQSALPLGSVIERSGLPAISMLDSDQAAWPDSVDNFKFVGYKLNKMGEPTFEYQAGPLMISDHLSPDESNNRLVRKIDVEGEADNAWVLVAESESIEDQGSGVFLIDGQTMYVEIETAQSIQIREVNDREQLVVPISLDSGIASLKYTLIW